MSSPNPNVKKPVGQATGSDLNGVLLEFLVVIYVKDLVAFGFIAYAPAHGICAPYPPAVSIQPETSLPYLEPFTPYKFMNYVGVFR